MKRWILGLCVAFVLACLFLPWAANAFLPHPGLGVGMAVADQPPAHAPHVKVLAAKWVGSAVHIGNGFYITAGHVAKGLEAVRLQREDRSVIDAEVLWENRRYDVALLKARPDWTAAAELDCAPPVIGQTVIEYGSPLGIDFVFTTGRIIGNAITLPGMWKVAVPMDLTLAPGQSGGGVIGPDGKIVGIGVGVHPDYAFSFMVPGETLCMLMGRS